MPDLATPLPCRRPELVSRPLGDNGSYLVRNRNEGESFQLGAEEHFLLARLDGTPTTEDLRAAFAERFGEPLEVAGKRYASPAWARTHKSFVVSSLRPTDGGTDPSGRPYVDTTAIAEWDGSTASQAHLKTMPMLAAFGIIDVYANLEEVVFDLYKLYLNHNPKHLPAESFGL